MYAITILTKQAGWEETRSTLLPKKLQPTDNKIGNLLDNISGPALEALQDSPIATALTGAVGGGIAAAAKNPFLKKIYSLADAKAAEETLRSLGPKGIKANLAGGSSAWGEIKRALKVLGSKSLRNPIAENAGAFLATGHMNGDVGKAIMRGAKGAPARGKAGATVTGITALIGAIAAMSAKGKIQGY